MIGIVHVVAHSFQTAWVSIKKIASCEDRVSAVEKAHETKEFGHAKMLFLPASQVHVRPETRTFGCAFTKLLHAATTVQSWANSQSQKTDSLLRPI